MSCWIVAAGISFDSRVFLAIPQSSLFGYGFLVATARVDMVARAPIHHYPCLRMRLYLCSFLPWPLPSSTSITIASWRQEAPILVGLADFLGTA